ncbi:MAG: flagellar hook-basal body complex protein FliE [Armatimonadetes bacterium]|nr:flagellar hook-basal body complex protein FliE [Armatimonadota bacterium]
MRIGSSLREFQVPAPPVKEPAQTGQPGQNGVARSDEPFLERLTQAVRQVNDLQGEAGLQVTQLATGQTRDLSQVVTAVEKADLALQLTVHVTQKAVQAYQEISRLQV